MLLEYIINMNGDNIMNDSLKDFAEPSIEELPQDDATQYLHEDEVCNADVHLESDYDDREGEFYGCDDDSDGYSDIEADADTLASAGYGTDEDYGCFDSGDEW